MRKHHWEALGGMREQMRRHLNVGVSWWKLCSRAAWLAGEPCSPELALMTLAIHGSRPHHRPIRELAANVISVNSGLVSVIASFWMDYGLRCDSSGDKVAFHQHTLLRILNSHLTPRLPGSVWNLSKSQCSTEVTKLADPQFCPHPILSQVLFWKNYKRYIY